MNREQVIHIISDKMKLIRTENGFSQDKMAEILGISKKTLVQIEKGRTLPGWNTVVAVTALFHQSEVLQNSLGDEPLEVIRLVTFEHGVGPVNRTLGGKVWWKDIRSAGSYTLQQNLISQHYRILDPQRFRWFSTFDEKEAYHRLEELRDDRKS
ncbi:helix-turn-helix transcriptional regulator [Jeotgalibacillus haloalkalitolerans]|uniref:Helix-turn-helix domain-containing protein n=1 Tax=Jeotgalibacillus haloalkalitolerans TaxID=3104292 RepID=A0ABU5KIL6_9BACL|nr:helix-turn-helix domain-containing protein [Jeotgalibacillus sp. HH7-29]MDZ5710984.1 helix-turn-helix domain-containing protein [Jeotgalibacillus sp. HH7-29]